MSDHYRWNLDELITRYELEPELKDIFVEGSYDQEVLMNCYRSTGQSDKVVYDINSVNIPNELLISHGLTDGNKQRVIVLARELATIAEDCSYKCIVDRDLDHWFDALETTPRLIWLEFCSIELYFFSKEVIENLLINAAKSKITDIDEYIESIIHTLSVLFALRLTDRDMGSSLVWLSIDRCLTKINNSVVFDTDEYINRILLSNSKTGIKVDFRLKFAEWKLKLKGDHRNYIRGHDFIAVLAWTVSKFKGIKEFAAESTIERTFVLLSPTLQSLEKL